MKKKEDKKILFLINDLDKGGAEKILSQLSNFGVNHGYKITIIFFGKKIHYDFDERVIIIKIDKFFFNIFKYLKNFKNILKEHSSNNNVIISHLTFSNYFNIIMSFFTKHKPIIVSHHTLNYYLISGFRNTYKYPLHFCIQKILYKYSYNHISVSLDIKEYYRSRLKINSELIYNPLFDINFKTNYKTNPLPKDKINIIVVGSLINVKNHIELFKCVKKNLKKYCIQKNVHFTIIGTGPFKEKYRNYLIKNDIDGLFSFVGIVDNTNLYYQNCDFLISTSKLEGLPTVLIEALCYSKPVISSFQRSALEIMIEKNFNFEDLKQKIINNFIKLKVGYVYSLGNTKQLSDSIISMIEEGKKDFLNIDNNSKNMLNKFSLNNFFKYVDLIK